MTRKLLLVFTIALAFAAPAPSVASTLFALVDTGELFASGSAGATWEVRATLPVSDAVALIGGVTPEELYLVTESGLVRRSTDAGVGWNVVGSVPASDIVDLAGRDGALFALSRSGLAWRSLDFGVTFEAMGSLGASDATSLVVGSDLELYAATRSGLVFHGTGDGASWTVVGTVPASDARVIRSRTGALYVLLESGIVYRSDDSGASWAAMGTTSQVGMSGLAALGVDLLAVTREGLVGRSGTGAAWSWVGHVNQLRVRALATDVPQVSGVPAPPAPSARLRLASAWPNPVRAGTPVVVQALGVSPDRGLVLDLFDPAGRFVARRDEPAGAFSGSGDVHWPTDGLGPGVYHLRARQGAEVSVRRIVVID